MKIINPPAFVPQGVVSGSQASEKKRCEIIGRWQAGEEISPKSQDADIENVTVTNQPNSHESKGFFIIISTLKKGAALRFLQYPLASLWTYGFITTLGEQGDLERCLIVFQAE
jgi:hypothetical protein